MDDRNLNIDRMNICFVAQNSYGALTGNNSNFIGGVEIQIPLMARWFASRGYAVSLICWDEDYGEEISVDGIRVISLCERNAGIPGVRFFYPRWSSLIQALRRASPDVIYYNYGDLEFGQIMLWARKNNVPVLYSVANNEVCLRELPSLGPIREKLLYRYGLNHADKIIVQTQEEQESLSCNFNLNSTLIPMPNPGFKGQAINANDTGDQVRVLWVGRFTEEKRLPWLLEIAKKLPQVHFDIVGGASIETNYSRALKKQALVTKNVTVHGKLLRHDMALHYSAATLLCSTSSFEGFPNVFLEAWSVGLPVVATIDPDNLIVSKGLGRIGDTVDELVEEIQDLIKSKNWSIASQNALQYFHSTHRPEVVMERFEAEILDLNRKKINNFHSAQKDKKPSLCLLAHNAYGVLAKKDTSHVGGIEVQVPMMSKWFVEQGYSTTMVAWDNDYPDGIRHDGVVVRKLCKESDGIPIIRFIYPRWTSFVAALKRADSDVYYYNCGDMGLGQLVLWARLNGKKVVYSIANDVDCVQELPALKPLRERLLYKYGLMNCDRIVCQTEKQKSLLFDEFGLDARVIRMPCEGFQKTTERGYTEAIHKRKRILWAGRFTPEKRLEYFLELAKHFPEMIFDVIGDYNFERDTSYAERMKEIAEPLENVILHGRVPHEKMGEYFNRSYLLCSTSLYEGFPNIYLEAWSVGLPLVTTFDPDGVVERYAIGRTATDIDSLQTALKELMVETVWHEARARAETYYLNNHTVNASMREFEKEVSSFG